MSRWMTILLEEEGKNKSHAIHSTSGLSAIPDGLSVTSHDPGNILKTPYIRTDNTDSNAYIGETRQPLDILSSFANAIDTIRRRNRPRQIRQARWTTIVQRLDVLVHDERRHLLKMIEYDWPLAELFGCHKFAPDVRIDGMGLMMLLAHSTIAEIHPDKALLRSKRGSITAYYLALINRSPTECSTLMEVE
jgi:hypothetical protein